MASSSGKGHGSTRFDLTLEDEVRGVLAKNEMLFSMRLEAKEAELQHNKQLVRKLTRMGGAVRGEEATGVVEVVPVSQLETNKGIATRFSNFAGRRSKVLDLSDQIVETSQISQPPLQVFLRELGVESPPEILHMRNCGLKDHAGEGKGATDALLALIKTGGSDIKGIDLSGNDLGSRFWTGLLSALESRSRAPQYLLLHDNMQAHKTLALKTLLPKLTDETWGFSISVDEEDTEALTEAAASSKSRMVGHRYLYDWHFMIFFYDVLL